MVSEEKVDANATHLSGCCDAAFDGLAVLDFVELVSSLLTCLIPNPGKTQICIRYCDRWMIEVLDQQCRPPFDQRSSMRVMEINDDVI